MWLKWLPWKIILKKVARAQGFIDPILLMSQFNRFAQPSEVLAPIELLRAGAVLHARGLINSQVIQHNLDWIWPYWAQRQFDPLDPTFIPRAFSMTHINLTHRNWTAVGVPGFYQAPVVDPRGLVMPFFDSWSVDSWIIAKDGTQLIPSRVPSVNQIIDTENQLSITTESEKNQIRLVEKVAVDIEDGKPSCRISLSGHAPSDAWLLVSLRPYNPEGISFIHTIDSLPSKKGWVVDKKYRILFGEKFDWQRFSRYKTGDVYHWTSASAHEKKDSVICDVGMATSMAAYALQPNTERTIGITIPLDSHPENTKVVLPADSATSIWEKCLQNSCDIDIPLKKLERLYKTAIRTLLLHTPKDSYAGPYTYKRFWFRDAAFIVHALLNVGLVDRARQIIDQFFHRQTSAGYFLSQEGEWDSNGQVLWAMERWCAFSGEQPPEQWRQPIENACEWLFKKRTSPKSNKLHAGLLPSGFSAEHLGPNDHYYWDNFWGVAGLQAASIMFDQLGDIDRANSARNEARAFLAAIDESLKRVAGPKRRPAIPSSPYRRLDSAAVGSLAVSYPLQLWDADDERVMRTADFLVDNCLIDDAFYHDVSHSGINPYLTLHIAQTLLRAGDTRFWSIMNGIARLASQTGQWPEAIHPQTKTGCMGDGQHVWAAAEWLVMMRNSFVREERAKNELWLCTGITSDYYQTLAKMTFGPAPTPYGMLSLAILPKEDRIEVSWKGEWHGKMPEIIIAFPGLNEIHAEHGKNSVEIPLSGV